MSQPEQPTRTGHPDVDHALARLDALEATGVAEHAEIFDRVHQALRATLRGEPAARPDARPDAPPDTRPDTRPGAG